MISKIRHGFVWQIPRTGLFLAILDFERLLAVGSVQK